MTERNRIIDAFRNCITEPKCKDCQWTECNTLNNGCVEIQRDLTLAVMRELVAQEPRVMTLDLPAQEWNDKVIWFEVKNKKPIQCMFMECVDRMMFGRYEQLMYFDFMGSSKKSGYVQRQYGKAWRYWTSRPSYELQKVTPWE